MEHIWGKWRAVKEQLCMQHRSSSRCTVGEAWKLFLNETYHTYTSTDFPVYRTTIAPYYQIIDELWTQTTIDLLCAVGIGIPVANLRIPKNTPGELWNLAKLLKDVRLGVTSLSVKMSGNPSTRTWHIIINQVIADHIVMNARGQEFVDNKINNYPHYDMNSLYQQTPISQFHRSSFFSFSIKIIRWHTKIIVELRIEVKFYRSRMMVSLKETAAWIKIQFTPVQRAHRLVILANRAAWIEAIKMACGWWVHPFSLVVAPTWGLT